jgi:kynurenine formamidase
LMFLDPGGGTVTDPDAELLGYFEQLSNWGRWGEHDELGTLNLITDENRRRAAELVRTGRVVSCAWDIDTADHPGDSMTAPRRMMVTTGQGLGDAHRVLPPHLTEAPRGSSASEHWMLHPHGYRLTHLDGLSHIFWDNTMYGGRPAELVTAGAGATELDITGPRHGIVTRGVLIDAAAHRGVDWLAPGETVSPDEVAAILRVHDLEVGPGDAVLLRTGYGAKVAAQGRRDNVRKDGRAGWHATCLSWLHRNDIAVLAADTANDADPCGYPGWTHPIHFIGIVAMGLWLVDNCNLEALAATCRELGRWDFSLTIAPLAFVGATGSPVNPLAMF